MKAYKGLSQKEAEELLAKNGLYRQLYETQFRTILDLESANG